MYKALITCILLLSVPALGQLPGDLTCNGVSYEIADAVEMLNVLLSGCSLDSIGACTLRNGGIDDSNSTTIFDWWTSNYENFIRRLGLYCVAGVDPQGHNGLQHGNPWSTGNWGFRFHVVGTYQNTFYDAVFNERGDKDSDYGRWFQYYYTWREQHVEPPIDPPAYYSFSAGKNPGTIFKYNNQQDNEHRFCHLTPCFRLLEDQNNNASSPIISRINYKVEHGSEDSIQPWDTLYNKGISMFIDTLCGRYYMDLYVPQIGQHGRTINKKAAGDYLSPPWFYEYESPPLPLGQPENEYLSSSLSGILTKSFWNPEVLDYLQQYKNILNDTTRNEFYGRVAINGKKFVFGGWIGKLTVTGVYDDYSDVSEFINKAKSYFRLPDINPRNVQVVISESGGEFFYSFLDRKNKFWLRGYKINLNNPIDHSIYKKRNVIELLKYYAEDFVP